MSNQHGRHLFPLQSGRPLGTVDTSDLANKPVDTVEESPEIPFLS
ncbi:MAG: hypothetical protein ABI843_08890 [Dokdonella sp.]